MSIVVVVDCVVGVGVVLVVVRVVVIAQTCKPSSHVCWKFMFRGFIAELPHLPNQEPPRLQHVGPRGLGTHLGHSGEKRAYYAEKAI